VPWESTPLVLIRGHLCDTEGTAIGAPLFELPVRLNRRDDPKPDLKVFYGRTQKKWEIVDIEKKNRGSILCVSQFTKK